MATTINQTVLLSTFPIASLSNGQVRPALLEQPQFMPSPPAKRRTLFEQFSRWLLKANEPQKANQGVAGTKNDSSGPTCESRIDFNSQPKTIGRSGAVNQEKQATLSFNRDAQHYDAMFFPQLLALPEGKLARVENYRLDYTSCQLCKPMLPKAPLRYRRIENGEMDFLNMSVAELYLLTLNFGNNAAIRYNHLDMTQIPEQLGRLLSCQREEIQHWDEQVQFMWRFAHSYSYVQRCSAEQESQKFNIMLQYLNRVFGERFGITGQIESRSTTALCLVRDSDISSHDDDKIQRINYSDGILTVQNIHPSIFAALIDEKCLYKPGIPVVDESGNDRPVSMRLPWNFKDPMELNPSLARYGLKLVKKTSRVPMIVLTTVQQSLRQPRTRPLTTLVKDLVPPCATTKSNF